MRKKVWVYRLFSPLLLWCFYACVQEDGFTGNSKVDRFFNAFGADEDVCWISEQLKLKNDSSDFVPGFVAWYGYPLWKEAYRFPEGENTVYAIPVKSTVPGSEINGIWFFCMGQDSTNYRIYTRDMAENITTRAGGDGVEETWMFDYFTINALDKKPASGISFASDAETRAIYEEWKCVHAFAGVGGYLVDKGWHCWITGYVSMTMVDFGDSSGGGPGGSGGPGSPGSPGGSGSFGGGGGSGSGSNGTPTVPGNPKPQDPDKEDRSPCGAASGLSSNVALKSKVNNLFNAVQNYRVGDTENGWIKTATGEYVYPTMKEAEHLGYAGTSLSGKKITEQYHSHPAGAPFPSWADLKVLATRYQRGQIDVANFSYGVVSNMGCFTMVITSESAFSAFTKGVLNNPKLKEEYDLMHEKKNTNGVDTAIAKFIDFLKASVSGLNVLFNEASYGSNGNVSLGNWQAKDSNGNASISNYNCN
jgi:hypothetical protein